jgi:serine phosphatase RsbU (regulator of sigma subunit)/predicted enzyme related to lactoylglutathione lyase
MAAFFVSQPHGSAIEPRVPFDAIMPPMSSSPSSAAASQSHPEPEAPHPHLRVHAINIFVRDQDVSLKFYLDQLGFSLMGDVRFGSGERWVAVAPPDGSTVLSLVSPKPESKQYALIGKANNVVFVTEDVLAKYREWHARGVKFRYAPRLKRVTFGRQTGPDHVPDSNAPVWGGVITHFADPDGNVFGLVSYDEESRAVEAQRRAAAAKLESERRAAQELEIAQQVQLRLFPQTFPPATTLEYSGTCLQARQVGGDYYDFLDLGRDRLGLVVADISGKGIAAALLMANLQANLRSQCATASDQPDRFLRSLNRLFYENSTDSSYATLFFAEYHDPGRRLRYANCGHLSALLLRADDELKRLDSTCTVMGLFPEWNCATAECELAAGDILTLYTDGLTESFNHGGQEFGEYRLIESVRRHRHRNPCEIVDGVLRDVRNFSHYEQADDMTLIVAKCR